MCKTELPRDTDSQLSKWAWPGGYPIFYLDSGDNVLCADCARKSDANKDDWPDEKPVAADVNYEDSALYCDNCSERIESAYAED